MSGRDDKLNEIARVLFPQRVSRAGLLRLGAFDRVDVEAGKVLAESGDPALYVYVVLDGEVELGHRRYGPGALLGDAAAVAHAPWAERAVVAGGARLLVIPANRFTGVLAAVPELNAQVMRSLSRRLVAAERHRASPRALKLHGVA